MPPTFDATTAVPHAIASRFTMPSGSYSDGQANTVACESSWMTSGFGSIPDSQMTPDRVSRRCVDQSGDLRAQLRACPAPGAEHELDVRVEESGGAQQAPAGPSAW